MPQVIRRGDPASHGEQVISASGNFKVKGILSHVLAMPAPVPCRGIAVARFPKEIRRMVSTAFPLLTQVIKPPAGRH